MTMKGVNNGVPTNHLAWPSPTLAMRLKKRRETFATSSPRPGARRLKLELPHAPAQSQSQQLQFQYCGPNGPTASIFYGI